MNRWLAEILQLDPAHDAQRIVFLDSNVEFPWDTERALELAFFRTYAVPSIAGLLAATGELTRSTRRRHSDTRLVLSTLGEHGLDSERGREALRRLNGTHGRFEIANEDNLYVLSALALEPIRWNARYGWRPLVDTERQASYAFWVEVGRRMGLEDIPGSLEELDAFNVRFERERFAYSDAGHAVAEATLRLLRGRRFAQALLDEPLLAALGLRPPARWERAVAEHAVRSRSALVRRLPPRRSPVYRAPVSTVRLSGSAP